jgi:hypothetical protein
VSVCECVCACVCVLWACVFVPVLCVCLCLCLYVCAQHVSLCQPSVFTFHPSTSARGVSAVLLIWFRAMLLYHGRGIVVCVVFLPTLYLFVAFCHHQRAVWLSLSLFLSFMVTVDSCNVKYSCTGISCYHEVMRCYRCVLAAVGMRPSV